MRRLANLVLTLVQDRPMPLLKYVICLTVGALSAYAFGDYFQAHNPFSDDFRVQAYAIPFFAGFMVCRHFFPVVLVLGPMIAVGILLFR